MVARIRQAASVLLWLSEGDLGQVVRSVETDPEPAELALALAVLGTDMMHQLCDQNSYQGYLQHIRDTEVVSGDC